MIFGFCSGLIIIFSSLFSVPRVSIDGNSHEILTLVVCLSGLLLGIIIVVIIVLLLNKVKGTDSDTVGLCAIPTQIDIEAQKVRHADKSSTNRSRIRIFTIFGSSNQSFDLN